MQSRLGTAFVIVSSTLAILAACASASNSGFSDTDAGIGDATSSPGVDAPISIGVDTGTSSQPDTGSANNDDSGNSGSNEAGVCVTDPPNNKCGVAPQCGCEATETCDVIDNSGDVGCIAFGLATQGQACTTTANCAQGLTCLGDACRQFCPSGTANNAKCGLTNTNMCFYVDNGATPIPNLHICQINCDPAGTSCAAADGIPETIGCVVTDSAGDTDCIAMGAGANGASCPDATGCKPGYLCVTTSMDASAPGTCRQWCKVVGGTCGTGTCNELNPKVVVNGTEYGECE